MKKVNPGGGGDLWIDSEFEYLGKFEFEFIFKRALWYESGCFDAKNHKQDL